MIGSTILIVGLICQLISYPNQSILQASILQAVLLQTIDKKFSLKVNNKSLYNIFRLGVATYYGFSQSTGDDLSLTESSQVGL